MATQAENTVKISVPTKDEKLSSQLIDACRLLTWQAYKAQHKVPQGQTSFNFYSELYQKFEPVWKQNEIHQFDTPTLINFVIGRGYTVNELLNFRAQEYQKRNRKPAQTQAHNFDRPEDQF